jgi:hypothetical protein
MSMATERLLSRVMGKARGRAGKVGGERHDAAPLGWAGLCLQRGGEDPLHPADIEQLEGQGPGARSIDPAAP